MGVENTGAGRTGFGPRDEMEDRTIIRRLRARYPTLLLQKTGKRTGRGKVLLS
jgi:hypothetical protein